MKSTAELKMLPVSVLKPAAYNPRKKLKPGDKEYEKIKNSIEEFGFADPLVVNADMTTIGGHQRLTVAMALGYTEVPCAVVDIDKTREKALNIALNKITGAWDDSLLADLLKDIENSNFDLGKTGFDPPEIETLFNKVHDKDVKEDDFDVESELKQPTFSQAGDLWVLGRHRVLCGDSTKAECYDTLMDGVKANLVLSDPPYNVDVEETAGKIMNDNMGDSEFYEFLLAAFKQMHSHLADDGSIYIFHADTEGLNFRKAFKDAGFYLSGCCIWKKNALVLGRSPYQWQHEPCLYGWKQKGKHQWYIKEGTLKVNYGPDTTGEKEAINVPQGTRFDQYTHSDTGGRYFAEEGADYDSLNLPDVEDKRTLSTYEVVEDGLEVDQSGIAYQPWQDKTGDNGSFQYNFPKMDEYGKRLYGEDGKPLYMSTEELLESGKIRKVEK